MNAFVFITRKICDGWPQILASHSANINISRFNFVAALISTDNKRRFFVRHGFQYSWIITLYSSHSTLASSYFVLWTRMRLYWFLTFQPFKMHLDVTNLAPFFPFFGRLHSMSFVVRLLKKSHIKSFTFYCLFMHIVNIEINGEASDWDR